VPKKPYLVCDACGGSLRPLRLLPGYVRGPTYQASECNTCGSQTISPRSIPAGLYDAIYQNAATIQGGYDRYERYAAGVRNHPAPLQWLADQEDMYWGVVQLLKTLALSPNAQIVEVGCGLGYLTYALSQAGYNAHGIDISERAVHMARGRFGDLFTVEDATQSTRVRDANVVLALELIEHLPTPAAFLASLREVLPVDASLIMSTPNRDTYPADSVWNTDLPPVHFNWFSESGISQMAADAGYSVHFADFSKWNSQRTNTPWLASPAYREPRFDEALHPLATTRVASVRRSVLTRMTSRAIRTAARAFARQKQTVPAPLAGNRSVAMVFRLARCKS